MALVWLAAQKYLEKSLFDTTSAWTMAGGFLGLRRRLSLSRQASSSSTKSDSSGSIIGTSLSLSQKVNGAPTSVTNKNVEQRHSDGDVLIRTPTSESNEEWDTLAGRRFCIMVHPHDTIDHVKMKIRMKEGISEDQQRLFFKGRQLEGGCLLDWDLYDMCVIFLTLRLRGG